LGLAWLQEGQMTVNAAIREILAQKPGPVWSISPEATVLEAIQLMADKNIGALLVMEGDRLIGVMSERDYARRVLLKGRSSRDTKVREIASIPALSVTPSHTVEECMRLMTEHRVRHLPVLEEGKVVGIVSIGDLVNWVITAQNATIQQLQTYITGIQPG
jgi:signal-transduction protein with cAMP-binding, CBS, and nucleotidyltransferase domain